MGKIKPINRLHPGPQKTLWSMNYTMITLSFFIILSFLLIIYSILQENSKLLLEDNVAHRYFNIKLVDIKTSFATFVSLIGLVLLRHHFLVGTLPRINYEGAHKTKATFENAIFKEDIWQVKLRNVGLGAAIIKKYMFRVSFDTIVESTYDKTFYEVVDILSRENIRVAKDFCLFNITGDYTIASKDEKIVFEIAASAAVKIKQIDLCIEFRGLLGSRFKKEVFLVPRLGIPKVIEIF